MTDNPLPRSTNAVLIRMIAVILVALVIAAGYFAYQRHSANYTVETEDDGRAIGRVIDARLDEMGDLRVSLLHGNVQGVSRDPRLGGLQNTTRVMKAPFEVGYFVDLSTHRARSAGRPGEHRRIADHVRSDAGRVRDSRRDGEVAQGGIGQRAKRRHQGGEQPGKYRTGAREWTTRDQ